MPSDGGEEMRTIDMRPVARGSVSNAHGSVLPHLAGNTRAQLPDSQGPTQRPATPDAAAQRMPTTRPQCFDQAPADPPVLLPCCLCLPLPYRRQLPSSGPNLQHQLTEKPHAKIALQRAPQHTDPAAVKPRILKKQGIYRGFYLAKDLTNRGKPSLP